MRWFEPQGVKEWMQRGFSLRLGLLLAVIVMLVVTELRFDWLEKSVGAYLATTNEKRPESGAIWDLGHQTQTARKNLAEIIGDNNSAQPEARAAENFSQVLSGLSAENGISISAAHFRKLYDNLPAVLSQELLSPYSLLQLEAQADWVRTYFTKSDNQIHMYLLDRENQVLKEVAISQDLANYIIKGEIAIAGSLKSFADFATHIYPADLFFNVMETLPEALRRAILPQPEVLLNTKGKLLNVGISSEEVGGSVAIGFEYEQDGEQKVILVQGRQEDVEQLRAKLSEQLSGQPIQPGLDNSEGRP